MIKAYLVGISVYHEGEDIEIRYAIFENEELICKKTVFQDYRKPLVVTQVALITLLKELDKYKEQEITLYINDAALMEQVRGTTTSQNKEVIKMAGICRSKLEPFGHNLTLIDVSKDSDLRSEWGQVLKM